MLTANMETTTVQSLRHIDPQTRQQIYGYLANRPEPTLAYDPIWTDILRDGLGHQPYYLTAKASDQIVGLLPLAKVESTLFGRYLVSLPYLNYGGPNAENEAVEQQLVQSASELANELDVRYLELRNRSEIVHPTLTHKKESKVLMWRELPDSSDALWKSFKPEVRNQIRKGEKTDLKAEWGREELLADFYAIFAENMRDLGTPVYSKRLFASMLGHLDERAELCVVRAGATPVSAAILLHGVGFTEVPSASSLRRHASTCCNMFMYHHLLLRAVERGQNVFDFGRSSQDSGTFKFKKQWGATPRPSIWQYHVRKGDVSDMRPDNPKYRRKIEAWKRLPLWLANLIGPSIIRGVP